jgi:hypothetical protein
MAYFQSQSTNLGNFWGGLQWHMLVFLAIWSILRPFGIFCGNFVYLCSFSLFTYVHLVYLCMFIYFIFPRLGICTVKIKIWQPCM